MESSGSPGMAALSIPSLFGTHPLQSMWLCGLLWLRKERPPFGCDSQNMNTPKNGETASIELVLLAFCEGEGSLGWFLTLAALTDQPDNLCVTPNWEGEKRLYHNLVELEKWQRLG